MDSILVISEESALAETLGSELPDVTVVHARLKTLAAQLHEAEYRLIVVDDGIDAGSLLSEGATLPLLKLARPVRLRELLYTIGERLQGKSTGAREEIPLAYGFRLSPSERVIRTPDGNHPIPLTEKETELLQCLLEAAGEVVSREAILKRVWGYSDDIATHTLETHIYRLRGKLRQANESLDVFSSEEGGYQLKW